MWKNLSYDAVGLYHYRRYLNFKLDDSWITHRTPGIPVFAPDSDLINYLTDVEQEQQIRNLLSVTDVIIPKKNPLNPTIKEQYISSTAIEPWNAFEEKINEKYFSLNNPSKYFQIVRSTPICNMFIMKKEIFNSYCKDLFEVINHVFQKIGTPYDSYGNRYPGFLAERFLGFWLHINKIPYIEAPIIEMK
jgi:hypothetical protein